jgi:hypothetical protein
MNYMYMTRNKHGVLALKIDIKKAYDIVNWDFLYNTLEQFFLLATTVNLIMFCVRASSLTLLWNSSKLSSFTHNDKLHQGDPLSPYLFVLCIEKLGCLISNKVSDKSSTLFMYLKGVRTSHTISLQMMLCYL